MKTTIISLAILLALVTAVSVAAQRPVRTDSKILYHDGPVMTATSNAYFIWYGNWAGRENTVNLLTDFATSYGGSPYARINTTYTNAGGIGPSGGLIYGGSAGDLYSQGASLTEAGAVEVITALLTAGGLPVDPRGIYLVLASPDVHFEGFCTARCQYHESFDLSGTELKYGIVGNPDRCPTSCAAQFPAGSTSPNADPGGDAMVSWMAHVLNETITNPEDTGWYDRYGLESSDKCQGTFGETYLTSGGALANMLLGARNYLIQQNWINDRRGRCSLAYP